MPPLDCMMKMRERSRLGAPVLPSRNEVLQVGLHHRLQICVDHDRAGAFVLAELRQDLV